MASYKTVTFKDLSEKRKEVVRKEIIDGWRKKLSSSEIAKKARVSPKSVSTALGNLTRQDQAG